MKILFVSSGNTTGGISTIVKSQGKSLEKKDSYVEYFTINSNGFYGYTISIFKLRRYLKDKNPNIIHAHYSLSAFVASLATSKPLVVSLMGSDVKEKKWNNLIIKLFNYIFWDICIVKSDDLKKSLGIKNAIVIPNGVDVEKFTPMDKEEAVLKLGWEFDKKNILFPANPKRKEKNFSLAQKAIKLLGIDNYAFHYLDNVDNNIMPLYFNASDILLLTSLWEGSPNVIKEAMACNCPIVSTEVGDVKWVLGDTEGCYLTSFKPEDMAKKITLALDFAKKTNGRKRIIELGLDSETVAKNIIEIYKEVLFKNRLVK